MNQDRHFIAESALQASGATAPTWLLFFVLISAVLFNFVLCFVNTKVVSVSRLDVAMCEVAIVAAGIVIAAPVIRLEEYLVLGGIVLVAVLLAALRADVTAGARFDVQPARDFLIPVVFFVVGTRCRSPIAADRIMSVLALIVVAAGVFEFLFLNAYTRYFDIISYYYARGSISAEEFAYSSAKLFVSGLRPEGRALFPFIGDHRVSSVFLEPVSPGNFAVLLFYWALVRSFATRRLQFFQFACALLLTVLADNRFGLVMCGSGLLFIVIVRKTPSVLLKLLLLFLPCAGVLSVIAIALANPFHPINDSFIGRSVSSGQALMSLNLFNWLGLEGVGSTVNIYDSGYAYTVAVIGAPALLMLWTLFISLKGRAKDFHTFQAMLALYYAMILCVSYSPFTIKTAAVAWFLLGALRGADATLLAPSKLVLAEDILVRQRG
jgi:putative polymerase